MFSMLTNNQPIHPIMPVLILAAGESKRLGQPKQLLDIQGDTLIERTIKEVSKTTCQPIIIVLGAYATPIQKAIQDYDITILHNAAWQEGMGSSLRLGMQFITQNHPKATQVICLVSDQPFLTAAHLEALRSTALQSNASIITTGYNGKQGVPALFKKEVYKELLKVEGDKGARVVIRKDASRVVSIQNEQLGIDIDTMEDYRSLRSL